MVAYCIIFGNSYFIFSERRCHSIHPLLPCERNDAPGIAWRNRAQPYLCHYADQSATETILPPFWALLWAAAQSARLWIASEAERRFLASTLFAWPSMSVW